VKTYRWQSSRRLSPVCLNNYDIFTPATREVTPSRKITADMGAFKSLINLTYLGLVTAQTAITVNLGTTYQQIDGFGFSQAFGRAKEFQNLGDTAVRRQGLDYLFNTTVRGFWIQF
jgi:hypothetical protein